MPRPLDSASPGIIVKEIDLTLGSIVSESDKIAGIVAPFAKGPIDVPTLVANENELLNVFGQPYPTDKHYEHWLTASSYLAYGGEIRVVRSDNKDLRNGLIGFSIGTIDGGTYFCAPEIDPNIDYQVNSAEFSISALSSTATEAIVKTKTITTTAFTRPRTFYFDGIIESGQPDQWAFKTSGISGEISSIYSLSYGNDLFVIGDQLGKISASTDGVTWVLRTSGIAEPTVTWTDSGVSTIALFSSQISGTSSFKTIPYTGQRVTTSAEIIDPTLMQSWKYRTSGTFNSFYGYPESPIFNIISGNGIYVLSLGDGGFNDGAISTSTNGIEWTQRTAGTFEDIRGLVFGNNTYVYGAGLFPGSGKIATSSNAIEWDVRSSPNGTPIQSLTFGNGLFVAGGGFSDTLLMTSTDAITWTLRTTPSTYSIIKVIYGNGKYVYSDTNGKIATSTNAIEWTLGNLGYYYSAYALKFLNNTFLWGNYYGQIGTSTDAISWTLRTSGLPQSSSYIIRDFAFLNNRYVVVGGTGTIRVSTDLSVWTSSSVPTSVYLYSVFADENNILVGGDNGILLTPSNIGAVTGTATTIANNLLGPASLSASYAPNFSNTNEGFWSLTLPWNIEFAGQLYSQIFIGANSYITFGSGSTTSSVSNSNPSLSKITISGGNNSSRRIYYGIEGVAPNRTYRVRFEGINYNITYSTDYPATNMVWEASFYENTPNQFDIQMGDNARQTPSSEIGLEKIIYQEDVYGIPNNNIFVGVGYSGRVVTSTDSIDWKLRTSGTTLDVTNIIYQSNGDDLGPQTLVFATDGSIWSKRTSGAISTLNSIIFGNNVYLASGGSGTLRSSTDRIVWIARTSTLSSTINRLLYVDSGLGNQLPIVNVNATVWGLRTTGTTANLRSFVFADNNYIVAGSSGVIRVSTNTISWIARTSGTTSTINALSYLFNQSEPFIISGASGILRSSTDAIHWTARTSGTTSEIFTLIFGNNTYIRGGASGTLAVSSNAIQWTLRTSGTTSQINILIFENNTYVRGGASGTLAVSSNAIHWELRTSGTASDINTLVFANNTYIRGGASGTLAVSSDAIHWGLRTTGSTVAINTITYTDGIFKTAGDSGNIRTSTDAIVWTLRTSNTTNSLRSFAYQNNTYVSGDSGTLLFADNVDVILDQSIGGPYLAISGGDLITSTNAIIWTRRTSGTAATINGFTYNNNNFVIAGNNGVILSSTNAVQWALRTSGTSNNITGLAFGSNTYVYTATFGRIATSPDAITWTLRTSGFEPSISQVDGGFTGVCSASSVITGTSSFDSLPNTGKRITTVSGSGTVTTIASNLLGPASLTASTSNAGDDNFWTLTLPFNISFNGATYSQIFVGTNSYITFGSGSSQYSGLSASSPSLPKIMISAADNSGQRIYYGTEGVAPNRTYRVIFEGTDSTGGTLGSPTMVYEATFYEASPNQIDIQMGVNARISNVTSPSPEISNLRFVNGNFVALGSRVSNAGSALISVSTNAIIWTRRTSGYTNVLRDISFGNGFYLAGGDGGGLITSSNLISWTSLEETSDYNINSLVFNNNIFSYVGNNGTISDSGPALVNPVSGPFVAIGRRGLIMTSTNAIVWTLRTSSASGLLSPTGTSNKLRSIVYGEVNNINLYVVSGDRAQYYNEPLTQVSTDGVHWKLRTMGGNYNANRDLIYVNGIVEKFISANETETMSSTNTIVWTRRTTTLGYYSGFNSFYFNNTTNEIIASGNNQISYSTDGIVWESNDPLGGSLPPSDNIGYYPYNYNRFYITDNIVQRTLYDSGKNVYVWVGRSGSQSYKLTGKIATSSIQNSLLLDYEHGYNVNDEIYVNLFSQGSWVYNSEQFISSYTRPNIVKTYVLDVLSPYEFKINPQIYNNTLQSTNITGILKIQRPVWKSAQYTIKDKIQTTLKNGDVVKYYPIEIAPTSATKITSPMNRGTALKIKFLDGSLVGLGTIESSVVTSYTFPSIWSDTNTIAIIETPELENLTSIGDSGNLLFFPQGIGYYADECVFSNSPSGYSVRITVKIPYSEVEASGLPSTKRIYIEDSNPTDGTYNGNQYGIYGNSGWYDVIEVNPNPELPLSHTHIYVEWNIAAPVDTLFSAYIRWYSDICTTPLYTDNITSESPILCSDICENPDIIIPNPTVKIKSLEHYKELGYDDNSLGGAFFAARNPGSWSNGLNISVIDSKADQILSGLSTIGVQVGYAVTQSLSGIIIPGIGTTYVLDGYLTGVISGIGSNSIDVKILNYTSNLGVVDNVDYQQNGVYKFSNLGNIGIGSMLVPYSSTLDWFDQQTLQITGIGTTGSLIKWNSIASRPQTTKYAAERNSRFDEIHVVVIDSLGTISGNPGTILEKHLNLSKAKDAQFSVGTPSYWRKYIENNSNYIFALDTPTNTSSGTPDGGGGGSEFIPIILVTANPIVLKEWKVKFGYYYANEEPEYYSLNREYNNGTLDNIDNIDKYEIFKIGLSRGCGDLSDLVNLLTGSTLDLVISYINNGGILWFNASSSICTNTNNVNTILQRLNSSIRLTEDPSPVGDGSRSSDPFVTASLFPELLYADSSGVLSGGNPVYQIDGKDTFVYEIIGNGLLFVSADVNTWQDYSYQFIPPDELLVPMYNLNQIFTSTNAIIGKVPPSPEDPDYGFAGFSVFRFRRTTEPAPIAESLSKSLTVNINWSGIANQSDIKETLPSTITFPIGKTFVDLLLTPVDDGIFEGIEDLTVTINQGLNYFVSPTKGSATIEINDYQNDTELILPESPLSVSVICTSPNASEAVPDISIAVPAIFKFSRTYGTVADFNSQLTLNVQWSGTANQNDFIETIPNVIVIPPRTPAVSVILTPSSDGVNEVIETITTTIVSVSNPEFEILDESATATIRSVDLSKSLRLFVSIIDEDSNYDNDRQSDWDAWLARPNPSQNLMIVLRPMPQSGAVIKPTGWNGIEFEVTRPGEGGGNTNYAELLDEYLQDAYFIQFAIDDSGSMTRNTIQEDLDTFIEALQSYNIIYREVSMNQSEAWIEPHLF